MTKKLQPYFISISAALLIGAVSALLTEDSMAVFQAITKPPLSPPAAVFPVVWTILYILMGISSAMVYISNGNKWSAGLTVYVLQLIVNFFWSLIFFKEQNYLFAFVWLVLLWVLVAVMIALFWQTNKKAAVLQLPYLLWITFAGYLNFAIYQLNT